MIDQQQMTGNPLDQLREAQGVFLEVLRNVRPEQMNLPTPDDEWDVRALINHVVHNPTWAGFTLMFLGCATVLWDELE